MKEKEYSLPMIKTSAFGYEKMNIIMSKNKITNIFKQLNNLSQRYRPHGRNTYFKAFSGNVVQLLT
jgi:hypothetical protein|nr:hypothetical protein [uncultured Schaedlerella sp.]